MIVLWICLGVVAAVFLWIVVYTCPWAPWNQPDRETKQKEPASEVGTIRIVEKMDEDGEEYYIAEGYGHGYKTPDGDLRWRCLHIEALSDDDHRPRFATEVEAQQAANGEIDRRRAEKEAAALKAKRKAHHKVMGEFKP